MGKMSLFQIILLCSFGALALAGVIIFARATAGGGGSTTGPVEIWGTLDAGAFTTVIRQLVEEDPRLRQVTYVQKRPEVYEQELTEALASGAGPDLFLLQDNRVVKNMSRVKIVPYEQLSREQFEGVFVDGANQFLTSEGIIAVPLVVDPLLLYWNKDTLAAAGFSQAPKQWNELYNMVSATTKRDLTNAIDKSGIAFGEYANVTHAKDVLSLLILQAGGSIVMRNSTNELVPTLGSSGGAQAGDNALRFYTDFANPVKTHYSWNRSLPESRTAFGAGDLALYFGPSSEEPLIRRINPNLNFAASPVPQIDKDGRVLTVGRVYGFALTRTSDNPSGALTVANILASRKASERLSQALGLPSARRDLLAAPPAGFEMIYRQAIVVRGWIDPDPERTEPIFRDMIERVTSGASKISEALQRGDEALGIIIREQSQRQ